MRFALTKKKSAAFLTLGFVRTSKKIVKIKGQERNVIKSTMIGRISFDNSVLSELGSAASKFGDRPAETRTRERNSKPDIATSKHAQEQERNCRAKLF